MSCFPTTPANSGFTFATFLLPCSSFLATGLGPPPVLDQCPFPARFAPFSPLPLLKYFCTLQLGLCLLFPCTLLALRAQMFFYVPFFECFLAIGACDHADLHWCTRINFPTFDAERVVTLSMMMLSSAMSNFSHGNVVPRNR